MRQNKVKIALISTGTLLCAVFALFFVLGCGSGGPEAGPFRYEFTAASGTLLRDLFLPKQTLGIRVTRDFCSMPTENEVQSYLTEVSGFNVSRLVRVSRLELVEMAITATSGRFDAVTSMSLYYLPAGNPAGEILLGTASSPTGFGDTIVLIPSSRVDFLDLIKEDDAYSGSECPKLRIELSFGGLPSIDIAYRVDVSLDAYVRLQVR
ncbi:MAG TPA: hypothetical protein PLD73_06330 [Candidatus Hydrogenedentes bacterium]|jgi:hypothetical protein|nr:hypothetical protein [Candidatus Hydrogenedentota bacterium]